MSVARPSTKMIATEATEAGEQHLVPGVAPITLADRLSVLAAQPMTPKRNPAAMQKPCDVGLFDEAIRDQTDLLDWLSSGG
jgi:uncharacterized protein (UPF0264 family)